MTYFCETPTPEMISCHTKRQNLNNNSRAGGNDQLPYEEAEPQQ